MLLYVARQEHMIEKLIVPTPSAYRLKREDVFLWLLIGYRSTFGKAGWALGIDGRNFFREPVK